ncbi:MAG: transposase [Myxococcota bacterium]
MPVATETVQRPAHDCAVPDALSAPAQLLAELSNTGVLETLGAALPLSRRAGYTGVPLVAIALAYLVAKTGLGLRPFWERYRRSLRRRIAAVAGCTSLPSAASTSRAMGKVQAETAHTFADAALPASLGLAQVLSHPSAVHRDSHGEPLHVLDIDPSVQAYRLRDLVEGDDYPEPERQAPGVPGYTGQYRGEVRIRHVAVCHGGAGVWLAYRVSDDNPRLSLFFPSVLSPAIETLARFHVPARQILVRGDAEFGSAGVAKAIVDLGVQLLVRIGRYRLLDRPEVQETLQRAEWEVVRSGGVREREATELGQTMLHPSTKSADFGTPGISLRVVVVRRKVESSSVPYGTLRDGYQYELFATTLPAEAWSAADIVELYAGRSAIENRFAQEDRELDLGRTFSYNPAGQAVYTALGLFLWNHWTCAGFLAAPPPATVPQPVRRVVRFRRGRPLVVPKPIEPTACDRPAPENVVPEPLHTETPPDPPPMAPDPVDPFPGASDQERQPVVAVLQSAFRTLGWSIDPAAFVCCPNGKRLFPFSVAKAGPHRLRPQIIIRTDVGACDACPLRPGCFSSTRPNMYKQICRSISDEETAVITAFLARHPPGQLRRAPPPRQASGHPNPEPTPLPVQKIVESPPPADIGPLECSRPSFPAAAMRQTARRQHADVRVEIRISQRRRRESPPPDLRRTRQTWTQREDRWRLDADVRLIRHIPHQPPKNRATSPVGG